MSEISAAWTGSKEAAATLGKLAEAMIKAAQDDGMKDCAAVVKQIGGANAPHGPTGRLGGAWGVVIARQGDSIHLQIGPTAPYARRNVLGFKGGKKRKRTPVGRGAAGRVKGAARGPVAKPATGSGPGRGRGPSRPHRAWFDKTAAESTAKFRGIIAASVNPARLKGVKYG